MSEPTTVDKIAMYVGGGLVLIGVFLIGLIEMFLGSSHPVSDEGQIPHELLIDPQIRSDNILAGLLVMGLYAVYKVTAAQTPMETGRAGTTTTRQD